MMRPKHPNTRGTFRGSPDIAPKTATEGDRHPCVLNTCLVGDNTRTMLSRKLRGPRSVPCAEESMAAVFRRACAMRCTACRRYSRRELVNLLASRGQSEDQGLVEHLTPPMKVTTRYQRDDTSSCCSSSSSSNGLHPLHCIPTHENTLASIPVSLRPPPSAPQPSKPCRSCLPKKYKTI